MEKGFDRRAALLAALALAALGIALCIPAVPQNPEFNHYSDQRSFLGLPNFLNIASNLPFLVVGLAGLFHVLSPASRRSFHESWERIPYAVLFGAIALVFFGSSYYHLDPTMETLFWDRIPLALLFATFLSITVIERIHARWGAVLLGPLLVFGVGSLVTWIAGERQGAGDIRFYVLLQTLAMTLAPLMIALFPARYTRGRDLLGVALIYAVAHACAFTDGWIFEAGGVVSGHTLKHLLSALAAWRVLSMLRARRPIEAPAPAPPARNLMTAQKA